MKKILIVGGALFFLFGCTSHWVYRTGDKPNKYAPTNESNKKNGVIKYLAQGVATAKRIRRETAYKEMYSYCGGKYKILKEVVASDKEGVNSSNYVYITFECED